jgi:hypothetical protein
MRATLLERARAIAASCEGLRPRCSSGAGSAGAGAGLPGAAGCREGDAEGGALLAGCAACAASCCRHHSSRGAGAASGCCAASCAGLPERRTSLQGGKGGKGGRGGGV